MNNEVLIAIDPGLDRTAIALFSLEHWHGPRAPNETSDLHHAIGAWTAGIDILTEPDAPIHVRLAGIADELTRIIEEHEVAVAYLETPAFDGDYYGMERRSSVNRLYEARGAILATLGFNFVRTHQWRAGQSTKHERAETLGQVFRQIGKKLPSGPRGGAREDLLDAIWIGAWALTTRLAADLKTADVTAGPEAPAQMFTP